MNNLSERLRYALKHAKMSQNTLAEKVGVTQQSIQRICSGKTQKTGNLISIAKALSISPEWLQTGLGTMNGKNLESLAKTNMVKSNIPLISWVQAGSWESISDVFQSNGADEYYPCPEKHSNATFALRVVGESMSPDFIDGEVIFVDPEVEPKNGSCVVVRQNGDSEATFKQLMFDGSDKYLKALNPNWPKKIIEMLPDATICGVVIGSYRKRN
jgi:SOS-response transcriptional repressor LexA